MELIILEETDSTNSYLKRLAGSGSATHGTVVCSRSQSAGRGQRGNTWSSPAGMGLYLSAFYILDSVLAEKQGLWAKAWAIAVQRYVCKKIGTFNSSVEIKWPNDILLDGRKVGGMLVENSVRGLWLSDCIVGVGINLNQDQFKDGFETPPVSLKMITGKSYDAAEEAVELASFMDWSLSAIQSNASIAINSSYDACLFGLHAELQFEHAGDRVTAVLRGVDENGRAVLETSDGTLRVSHPDYRLSADPASRA